ncbi:MAG: TolC family protein, partial [Helicobacter japonicus]|nr:TolC family protein [Helicobacter japonicus]
MKKWLTLIALLLNVLQAEYLSLESAYKQVLSQNDGLKSSQSALQKQEKLRSATKMLYLPQVSLDAAYIHFQEPIKTQFFDASGLSAVGPPLDALLPHLAKPVTLQDQNIIFGALNIVYPLFTGGKKYFANKLSQLALEDASLALKLKELSLFEDCAKLYYGVVLANQILETLEDANAGHLAHYQNALKLQEKGQIARLETLQAQVNYDKSNIEVQKARDNLDIA